MHPQYIAGNLDIAQSPATVTSIAISKGSKVKAILGTGLLDSPVRVQTRGGALTIAWAGGDNHVWMKGPARTVFEGTIDLQGPP